MSSTTINFRGLGYEASDGVLEVWLHFLVGEIDKLPHVSSWLKETREEWQLQATAGFGTGVDPDLDRFVTDETRREIVLSLSKDALRTLGQKGEVIGKEELNHMCLGGEGSSYLSDVPIKAFVQVGRYFIRLLNGELTPEENDARMWSQKDERLH